MQSLIHAHGAEWRFCGAMVEHSNPFERLATTELVTRPPEKRRGVRIPSPAQNNCFESKPFGHLRLKTKRYIPRFQGCAMSL